MHVLPADSEVHHIHQSRQRHPLKADYCLAESSASTKRVVSNGEKVTKGTISMTAFAREDRPCKYCGKVLSPSSLTKHLKTGACDKWAKTHIGGSLAAAEYYSNRLGKETNEKSPSEKTLSDSEYNGLLSCLAFDDLQDGV